MTEDQAKDWLTKVGGSLSTKQTIENAKSVEEALKMREITFVELVVADKRVQAVFGSPMVPRAVLFPLMVEWFIQSFGDQGVVP